MRIRLDRLRTGLALLIVASVPSVTHAQSVGATFTFNDTGHTSGEDRSLLRGQALSFPKYSGGGTLTAVTVTVSLNVSQTLDIYGSCGDTPDCAQWMEVTQYIHAAPSFSIAPGVLDRRFPIRMPGQAEDVALFGTGRRTVGEKSASATKSFGPLHVSRTINVDPADFHAFVGTGTVPIGIAINLTHFPICSWEEEDDSFLLYFDFTQAFLDCPVLNSTYVGTWAFSATVSYTAFASGFVDAGPHANAGGPYVGVAGVPVTFDASGSEVGASGASFAISRYEWDFNNDGVFDTVSSSPFVEHTFTAPYTGLVSLRVSRNDATNDTATASVEVTSRFDLDHDGDVDNADLAILLRDRGKAAAASACGVSCDFDGDGFITALDSRLLVTQCTRASCAVQ